MPLQLVEYLDWLKVNNTCDTLQSFNWNSNRLERYQKENELKITRKKAY